MNPRKEHYRRKLPHFQLPGQWYMITCSLAGSLPKGALQKFALEVEMARNRWELGVGLQESDFSKSDNFDLGKSKYQENPKSRILDPRLEYIIALQKYRIVYDKTLNLSNLPGIYLNSGTNRKIMEEALSFWQGKRLLNHAWCIMPNHFHWVISVFEKDETGKPVYLQDILHSVKLFTARRINQNEGRIGQLWENESFETTLRNDFHFIRAVNYTLNNPVKAGWVLKWDDWPGTFLETQIPGLKTPG